MHETRLIIFHYPEQDKEKYYFWYTQIVKIYYRNTVSIKDI